MSSFQQFSLPPYVIEAVLQKFTKPTPIQERVIPAVIKGKSVIGQADTGTGKTHAFLLPILAKIEREREKVQVVIVSPTRELAQQIYRMAREMNNLFPEKERISMRLLMGGTDQKRDFGLNKQVPQLVIGTPARLKSYVEQDILGVYQAKTLIVDEADLLIDLGFMEMVDFVAASMAKELQMLVFSATLPVRLQPFLKKYMENPVHIVVPRKKGKEAPIDHVLIPLRHRGRPNLVGKLLKQLNPYLAIVFVNSKKSAVLYYEELCKQGLSVGMLSGDLQMRQRQRVMKDIHSLKYQYVVATDLAARGIDIEGVSHIINGEIPKDLDFYIHRAGRTGRSEHTGVCYTIFSEEDESSLRLLEKKGIVFLYQDVKGDSLETTQHRHAREKRKINNKENPNTKLVIKKNKTTVKPGYKKKQAFELKEKQKRERFLQKKNLNKR